MGKSYMLFKVGDYFFRLNYVVYVCDVIVCCVIKLVCNIRDSKYGF